jgi:hypothetical protein
LGASKGRATTHLFMTLIFCSHCQQKLVRRTALDHCKRFWIPSEQRWEEGRKATGSGCTEYGANCRPEISPLTLLKEQKEQLKRDQCIPSLDEDHTLDDSLEDHTHDHDHHDQSFNDIPLEDDTRDEFLEIPIEETLDRVSTNEETKNMPTVDDRSAFYLSLLAWQTMFKVSSRAMSALFGILWIFMCAFGLTDKPNRFGDPYLPVLKEFSKDIEANILLCSAACPDCYKVYPLCDTYIENVNVITRKITRHGNYCTTPNCSALLSTISKRRAIRPKIPIYYTSIAEQLRRQILRPHFVSLCNAWRERDLPDNVLADVYDGDLWKEWTKEGFFSNSNKLNFGFWLNCDWFCPFDRTDGSIGVVYLVILNLPRELRLLEQNVITVGVWPDVGEHTESSSAFMECIVTQLEELFEGVLVDPAKPAPMGRVIRAVLFFVCSDIPAIRATCGLLSASATQGCHMCHKSFRGGGGSYGNFELDGVDNKRNKPRTNESQRENGKRWKELQGEIRAFNKPRGWKESYPRAEDSKKQISETWTDEEKKADKQLLALRKESNTIEREYGRWSPLHRLAYFNVVTWVLVDPMHNLYLGVAKKLMKVMISAGLLNVDILVQRIHSLNVPDGLGRVLTDVTDKLTRMTAEEMYVFVVFFSVILLEGMIPTKWFDMWRDFSSACKILSHWYIVRSHVEEARKLLWQCFCKYENLKNDVAAAAHSDEPNEEENPPKKKRKTSSVTVDPKQKNPKQKNPKEKHTVTPNMHLALCSISNRLLVGPDHVFWCFGPERLNGVIAKTPTNRKSIERTLLMFILRSNGVYSLAPKNVKLDSAITRLRVTGGEDQKVSQARDRLRVLTKKKKISWLWCQVQSAGEEKNCWNDSYAATMVDPHHVLEDLSECEKQTLQKHLRRTYVWYYPKRSVASLVVSRRLQQKSSRILLFNSLIGSPCASQRSSFILTHWDNGYHAAQVLYFCTVKVTIDPKLTNKYKEDLQEMLIIGQEKATRASRNIDHGSGEAKSDEESVLMSRVRLFLRPEDCPNTQHLITNDDLKHQDKTLVSNVYLPDQWQNSSVEDWLPVYRIHSLFVPYYYTDGELALMRPCQVQHRVFL